MLIGMRGTTSVWPPFTETESAWRLALLVLRQFLDEGPLIPPRDTGSGAGHLKEREEIHAERRGNCACDRRIDANAQHGGTARNHCCALIQASVSSRFRSPVVAPNFWTQRAPAALPRLAASECERPRWSPARKPPAKQSPAPVVSTTFTWKAGQARLSSPWERTQPAAPSFTTTERAP